MYSRFLAEAALLSFAFDLEQTIQPRRAATFRRRSARAAGRRDLCSVTVDEDARAPAGRQREASPRHRQADPRLTPI
jgi:hypothetical protein